MKECNACKSAVGNRSRPAKRCADNVEKSFVKRCADSVEESFVKRCFENVEKSAKPTLKRSFNFVKAAEKVRKPAHNKAVNTGTCAC